MCHPNRMLLLVGFLILCFQIVRKALAEDCVELRVQAWRIATCCKHEVFLDPDTMLSCTKSSDAEYPDHKMESVVCAFDCAYRSMGLLDGQYDISVEKMNARQMDYDDGYQKVFADAVDFCMATKDKIVQDVEIIPTACSSFAIKFHACVVLHVMQNCPADRWDASPICEKIQKGVPLCTR